VTAQAAAAKAGPRAFPPWLEYGLGQLLAFLGALVLAGIIGSIIIVAYGESPLFVYQTVWNFATSRPQDFAKVLEIATPLIFSGLAVAVAFKAGMFNIGVEGQYIVGMAAAGAAATALPLPGVLLLLATILAAMLASTLWAAVPAVLKVKTGAHEVVTTIMMNGIALSLVAWALRGPIRSTEELQIDLRTDIFPDAARMPLIANSLGLETQIPPSVHLTWLFPLALVACAVLWFLVYRTRLGYETRAIGSSAGSAEAGGISIGSTQIKVFLISGALAGLVGMNHVLGDQGYFGATYVAGLGFAGITVAFLGRNHPWGIPLAALLIGMLQRGQDGIAVLTDLPTEILIILEGVLILSVVVAYELVSRVIDKRRQTEMRGASP